MNTKLFLNYAKGITIVEAITAMTITFTAMASVTSLMLTYQLQDVRNEIKSGGIAAAEQLLDQLRQCNITVLPNSGTLTIPANSTSTRSPCGTTIQPLVYAGNKYYSAKVFYCPNSNYCDASTRHVQVQVFYETTNVFEAETVYTALQ